MNPRAKLTTAQAARYLHKSQRQMERMRADGTGPTWFKSGDAINSPCLYELADLDMWVRGQKAKQADHRPAGAGEGHRHMGQRLLAGIAGLYQGRCRGRPYRALLAWWYGYRGEHTPRVQALQRIKARPRLVRLWGAVAHGDSTARFV